MDKVFCRFWLAPAVVFLFILGLSITGNSLWIQQAQADTAGGAAAPAAEVRAGTLGVETIVPGVDGGMGADNEGQGIGRGGLGADNKGKGIGRGGGVGGGRGSGKGKPPTSPFAP